MVTSTVFNSSVNGPQLGSFKIPAVSNEPMKNYGPGSPERTALMAALKEARSASPFKVPIVVNGEKVRGDRMSIVFDYYQSHFNCRYFRERLKSS